MPEIQPFRIQHYLQYALFLQALLALMCMLSLWFWPRGEALSALLGTTVVMLTTWIQRQFFKRLPNEVDAKTFFRLMLMMEGIKWISVMLITSFFLIQFQPNPLWFALGFISAYLTYFLLWFKG